MKRLPAVLCALIVLIFSAAAHGQGRETIPAGPVIESLEFRDTTVSEAVRLIAEFTGANVFATGEAGDLRVTMIVRNTNVRGAIASIARVTGLSYTYDRETRAYLLLTNEQFANDIVITRDGDTRIFTLRHQNVVVAAQVIEALFGSRVQLNLDTEDPEALIIPDGDIQGSRRAGGSNFNDRNDRVGRNTRSGGSSGGVDAAVNRSDLEALGGRELGRLLTLQEDRELNIGDVVDQFGLEPAIYVTISRDHNLIYVRTADQQALASIEQIIRATDRPTMQVLLEMRILSLDLRDDYNAIFNFGLSNNTETFNSVGGTATTGRSGADAGAAGFLGGSLFFQIINDNLLSQIELLEQQNRARTIATPLLAASNNSPAELFVGQEAILTRGVNSQTSQGTTGAATTFTTTETEIRDVGQTVEIVPRINADRTVTLVIRQESSSIVPDGGVIPTVDSAGNVEEIPVDTVNTSRLAGTITARDATTIAVGGLFQNTESRRESQIPVFGDIPFLGRIGSSDVDGATRSELVLLITPHVYSTAGGGEAAARARIAALSRQQDVDRVAFDASSGGAPATDAPGQEQDYVAMTRFAASLANGFFVAPVGPYQGIVEANVEAAAPLNFGPVATVLAEPVASFRKNNLYVTTVLIENLTQGPVTLDAAQARGGWLAVTLEDDALAPRGQEGSRSFVYLLSNRPYEQALGQAGPGGPL
ncbi:MAG: DUF3438 family protein [Pseudomonadota bacterium]